MVSKRALCETGSAAEIAAQIPTLPPLNGMQSDEVQPRENADFARSNACVNVTNPGGNGKSCPGFSFWLKNPEDRLCVQFARGTATVHIYSPKGIGQARINWKADRPQSISIRLYLRGLEHLCVKIGSWQIIGFVSSHQPHPRSLRISRELEQAVSPTAGKSSQDECPRHSCNSQPFEQPVSRSGGCSEVQAGGKPAHADGPANPADAIALQGAVAAVGQAVQESKTQGTQLDAELRILDRGGKEVSGLPPKEGCFELRLSGHFLRDCPASIEIEWIDFYRY